MMDEIKNGIKLRPVSKNPEGNLEGNLNLANKV
jgi:hypothetical protein